MKLNAMYAPYGATKTRKRVGRGPGSGLGKTSGKGHKGQNANAPFKTEYAVINLSDLNKFENDAVITPELLKEMGIVKKQLDGIKVLGKGTLEKKVIVKANKFSDKAKEEIEKLGGKAEVI